MSKKKKTAKPTVVEASYLSSRIIDQLGHEQVMNWLTNNIHDDILVLEKNMQEELDMIRVGHYLGEQAKNARKYISLLKKIRKQQDKLLKLLEQFSAAKEQIDALYQS